MLHFLGRRYAVCPRTAFDERYIWLEGEACHIVTPVTQEEHVQRCVDRWVEREARVYLTQRVRALSQETSWHVKRVSFRRQSTIWGSCSSAKNLSLNLHLIHVDPLLIDYVLIHELAHTVEMNHSRAFWRLVGQYCPEYPQRKRELVRVHREIKEEANMV